MGADLMIAVRVAAGLLAATTIAVAGAAPAHADQTALLYELRKDGFDLHGSNLSHLLSLADETCDLLGQGYWRNTIENALFKREQPDWTFDNAIDFVADTSTFLCPNSDHTPQHYPN